MWEDTAVAAERRRFMFKGLIFVAIGVAMLIAGSVELLMLGLPLAGFGVYLIVKMAREFRRERLIREAGNRRAEGLCPTCGYDLRHKPARCPECGADPKQLPIQ